MKEKTNYYDGETKYFGITLTAKGIDLVEKLGTGSSTSIFEDNFSKKVLQVSIDNVTNSNIAIGKNNSQSVSINDNDLNCIVKYIDELIKKYPDNELLPETKQVVVEAKKEGIVSKPVFKIIGSILKPLLVGVATNTLTIMAKKLLGF